MKKVIIFLIFYFVFPTTFITSSVPVNLNIVLIVDSKESMKEKIFKLNKSIIPNKVLFTIGIIESGHFTSSIFRQANNAYGIKCFKKTHTKCKKGKEGYFKYYSSNEDGIKDAIRIIEKYWSPTIKKDEDWFKRISQKGYCAPNESKAYYTLCKKVYKKI